MCYLGNKAFNVQFDSLLIGFQLLNCAMHQIKFVNCHMVQLFTILHFGFSIADNHGNTQYCVKKLILPPPWILYFPDPQQLPAVSLISGWTIFVAN